MSGKYSILKVKDKSDTYFQKKDIIFDVPFKIGIVGRSQLSGKTNLLVNLISLPSFYGDTFHGDDIYIVSPSLGTEKYKKLIAYKEIPKTNLFHSYEESQMEDLYDLLEEEYHESIEMGEKPTQKLVVFDDIGFDGSLRKVNYGIMDKIACNGRHFLVSVIYVVQKLTQMSVCQREALTGGIFFSMTQKQLEMVADEFNMTIDRKKFIKAFIDSTSKKPHSFFVVNLSNPPDKRYLCCFEEVLDI